MPFANAQEAFDEFQRTGQYANSDKHFVNPEDFGAYKHMVPKKDKVDFRAKVTGNEQAAIQGLQQGQTREQMGIYNIPEQKQALWRRLGMGLGTGLDMNKAYNFGAGTALEVGTSDMSKRYKETRGITDVERQRHADFQRAGSPEAYWSQFRGNQIKGLLDSGAIGQDAQGYFNPGPNGPQNRYGPNLEGYNMGANNPGGAYLGGGGGGARVQPNASYAQPRYSSPYAQGTGQYAPPPQAGGMSPSQGFQFAPGANTGITGGMFPGGAMNFLMNAPQGGGSSNGMGGAQVSAYGAGMGKAVPGSPAAMQGGPGPGGGSGAGSQTGMGPNTGGTPPQGGGGTIFELPPGNAGIPQGQGQGGTGGSPFGPNPVPLPTGNGFVGGPGSGGGSGGGGAPPLPGFDMPPFNVNPFQREAPWQNSPWSTNSPWATDLMGQSGLDLQGQGFAFDRASGEYGRSLPKEALLTNLYGQVLGIDPNTGQKLTGDAANAADRQSFGMLAPQANRLAGDLDSAMERLRTEGVAGGARDSARGDILRGAQSNLYGMRQDLQGQALGGLTDIMNSQKGFDPLMTQAGQALLGADVSTRGQDIESRLGARGQDISSLVNTRGQDLSSLLGARGQDLEALLGQRGQDVQWGTGWGNINNSQMASAWDAYLRGRGQDMDLYSNTRGQDFGRQAAMAQARAQENSRPSWWQSLLGGIGGAAAGWLSPGGLWSGSGS